MLRKQHMQDRKTRGRSGFCWVEAVNLMKITAATSPAARWLLARSLIPGINSSGEPASLLNVKVLKNWNGYEVAHLRRLQEPQGGWTWQGRDSEPTAALSPGRAMEPPQRRAHYPEKPISAPEPRHLSSDIQTQARSFPGQRPGQVSTQVSSPSAQNRVRCKCSHHRKPIVSSIHRQCIQDLGV